MDITQLLTEKAYNEYLERLAVQNEELTDQVLEAQARCYALEGKLRRKKKKQKELIVQELWSNPENRKPEWR